MPGEHGPLRRLEAAADPRAAAESAIERALAVLENAPAPSVDQLSDLADAIDSLREGAFGVAADLAMVAQSSRTLPTARRPQSLARSLPDLKAAFGATRKFLRATPAKNSA
jgi:hypothetical protein